MFQNYWILLIEASSTTEEQLFFNGNDEKDNLFVLSILNIACFCNLSTN